MKNYSNIITSTSSSSTECSKATPSCSAPGISETSSPSTINLTSESDAEFKGEHKETDNLEEIFDFIPDTESDDTVLLEGDTTPEQMRQDKVYLQEAFEDVPKPMLTTAIRLGGDLVRKGDNIERHNVDVLFDSGSDLSLASEKIFKNFTKYVRTSTPGWTIILANGAREMISQYVVLQILIGDIWTQPVRVYLLKSLPTDMILGTTAMQSSHAVIDWANRVVSVQTEKGRGQATWTAKASQCWRHPVTLKARSTSYIPAGHTMAVEVEKPDERQLFGRSTKSGLFTPVRTALRLDQRFLIAYGYGELSGKVLVFNPGNAILRIRRGCEIAEFHPTNEIDVVTPESAAARKRDEADKARVKIEGSGRIVWQKQGQAQQSKLSQVEQAEAEVLQVEQAVQGKAVTQQFQHRMQRSKAQEEKVVQEEEKRLTLNNTQLKPLTNADLDELSEMEQYNLFCITLHKMNLIKRNVSGKVHSACGILWPSVRSTLDWVKQRAWREMPRRPTCNERFENRWSHTLN